MWLESVLARDNFYKDGASDSEELKSLFPNKCASLEEISLPHLW